MRRATVQEIVLSIYLVISIHALLAESDRSNGGTHYSNVHFYPRSPCGERLNIRQIQKIENGISIHALLAESDRREGPRCQGLSEFLSTLSLRRATLLQRSESAQGHNFYPRSPCGERLSIERCSLKEFKISIHALLAESDT